MKTQTPASLRTIARPLAWACLLASLAGCTLVPGLRDVASREPERRPRAALEGVPSALAAKANELVRMAEPAPRSVLEARNRINQSSDLVRDLLASEGFLAAEVVPSPITSTSDLPVLAAEPGPLFTVLTRNFEGRGDMAPEVARQLETVLENLPAGAPARTQTIEALDDELVLSLRRQGYAFAQSEGIDVLASRQDANVALTFLLIPGPRVALGQLVISDFDARNQNTVRMLRTWSDGDLFTPSSLDRLRTRLRSTGLYEGIGVTVSETAGEDGLHTVTATLVEGKPRTVGAGVSASTTEGVGVNAYWERRNLTGRADRLRIEGDLATLVRGLNLSYERPHIGRYGRILSIEAGVRQEETDAYDLRGVRLGAALAQPVWRDVSLSLGAELDATRTSDQRVRIAGGLARDQITLAFPLAVNYSDVADPLDPQSGVRLFTGLETGVSVGDKTPGYTRLQVSGATYRAIRENLVAAVRAEYGVFLGSKAVAPDKLFFAGGGGTVRGYPYQSLSPRDSLGILTGGRSLFTASAEMRWRASERFGYALFADLGAAADDPGSVFSEASGAVGLGLRYYPGFGPVRLDIAMPLDQRSGEAPVQIYISIGQAF